MVVNGGVVCSVRKDRQQIAKAEFCDVVVSLFLDKWLLDNINLWLGILRCVWPAKLNPSIEMLF
jgi:hypothetical protein